MFKIIDLRKVCSRYKQSNTPEPVQGIPYRQVFQAQTRSISSPAQGVVNALQVWLIALLLSRWNVPPLNGHCVSLLPKPENDLDSCCCWCWCCIGCVYFCWAELGRINDDADTDAGWTCSAPVALVVGWYVHIVMPFFYLFIYLFIYLLRNRTRRTEIIK